MLLRSPTSLVCIPCANDTGTSRAPALHLVRVCTRALIGYPATLPAKLKLAGGASCRDILPLYQCWNMRTIRTFRVIMCIISHQLLEF
ncbi:unnamed protein product [Musa acuminata var. zebrina]